MSGQAGQLLVGIAGAAVGSFFGMPQLGFLAGSLIGSFIFKPPGTSVGKMSDLKVTSSTYGAPIQKGYGHGRVGGNIIWSPPIKENSDSDDGGILGGKGGPEVTTYTYTWTGAVAICAGPIVDVTRIWADTKLVFDKTGQTDPRDLTQFNVNPIFYLGTEDQMPDPIMEAAEGVGEVPAHRGMAYALFNNIPLADYGNRVPNFSFEVVFSGPPDAVQTGIEYDTDTGGDVDGPDDIHAVLDGPGRRMFFFGQGAGTGGVIRCDLSTGAQQAYRKANDVFLGFGETDGVDASASSVMGLDGYLYLGAGLSNTGPVYKVDPDALVAVASFGSHTSDTQNKHDHFTTTGQMIPFNLGGVNYMLCSSVANAQLGVFCTDSMSVISSDFTVLFPDEQRLGVCGAQQRSDGFGTAFAVGHVAGFGGGITDSINIYEITVSGAGTPGYSLIASIPPVAVNTHWTHFNDVSKPIYDASDGTVIVGFSSPDTVPSGSGNHYFVKINPNGGSIMWVCPVNDIDFDQVYTTHGEFSFLGTAAETYTGAADTSASGFRGVFTIQTDDGSYVRTDWPVTAAGEQQIYDGAGGEIIINGSLNGFFTNAWGRLPINRAVGAGVPVGGIVSDLCSQVGLTADDIDVTDLAGKTCEGYIVNQQQTTKDSLSPLALAFLFDGVESDYKLKFVSRGHSSIASIPPTDMAIIDTNTNSVMQETRTQEIDLPREISIQFLDPTHDYQQATQYMRRSFSPVKTMNSSQSNSIGLPLVMEPDDAKQLAEVLLYTAWQSRVGYKVQTGWRYLKYDPTDMVTLNSLDGLTVLTRISEMNVGADLKVDIQALAEAAGTYNPNSTAYGGEFPQQVINGGGYTRLFLLDTPLLRDVDDGGRSFSRMYYAAGGVGDGWPGVELYRSADGSAYADLGGQTSTAKWGSALNVLPDTDTPFGTDFTSQLVVSMSQGGDSLASCTNLQMLNGANAAALLNPLTGVVEIIQFQNVTQNTDGSYTLDTLLRGRRGTEVYTGTHTVGEVFILLTTASGQVSTGGSMFNQALGDLGLPRFYKPVTRGQTFSDAPVTVFTDTGRALKPYAPVMQAAATSGSDIAISWERRTRVGGAWRDGLGTVSLNEDSESYEVDVYDGTGTTVLRTLTATSTSVTYLAADITTDFGSPPATLTMAVYQISGEVGRGFSKKVTVEVAP